jgi:beta-lactamase regulating signal transducer with metallopeptidase domain
MMPIVRSLPFFALATVMFALLGACVSALLARLGRAQLVRWDPKVRHRALMLLLALPLATGLLMLAVTTAPSWLALWMLQLDHCTVHDDTHAHLCFVHLPNASVYPPVAAILLGFGAWSFARALSFLLRLVRTLRVLRGLATTGEVDAARGAIIIDAEQPVCIAAGLVQPRVLVSRGLLSELEADAQQVVFAHERAHVVRRDAFSSTLGRVLAVLHFPWVADWLVRELDIAAEQACDEEAARAVGDRLSVASAIVQVQRMLRSHPVRAASPVALSLVQHGVERRVASLLDPAPARTSLRGPIAVVAVAAATLLALSGELHHLTEFLLSSLMQ